MKLSKLGINLKKTAGKKFTSNRIHTRQMRVK